MSWIAFAILMYVVTAAQSAAVPFFSVHGVRPDLMVIVAVQYALAARTLDAVLACWIIGLLADLTSIGASGASNVGLAALSYSLAALAVIGVRNLTFRDSVVTHLVFCLLFKFLVDGLAGIHLAYATGQWARLTASLWGGLYASIYTALLAPYGHWLLQRLRGPLGIGSTSRLRVG